MDAQELNQLIDAYLTEELSVEDHERLQVALKQSPELRAVFRERMDLEASLRTWASEDVGLRPSTEQVSTWPYLYFLAPVLAASIAVVAMIGWSLWNTGKSNLEDGPPVFLASQSLGSLRQQSDCKWEVSDAVYQGNLLKPGRLALSSGVAELAFSSGTNLLLEGPCTLNLISLDASQLLAGNVVVKVSELSDGFLLKTPDADIVDEGGEYAVSIDEHDIQVHVFEGSVLWEPDSDKPEDAETIEKGQARRFARGHRGRGARIPLGHRQFVRDLEASVQASSGGELLAYDGFENFAGNLRQGRSGVGWTDGWESARRGRGKIADIIPSPDDKVFGLDRSGRHQLRLSGGDTIVRKFSSPLPLKPGTTYFASFILRHDPQIGDDVPPVNRAFEFSLIGELDRRSRQSRNWLTFGITSSNHPFIKSVGRIAEATSLIDDEEIVFCVARIEVTQEQIISSFRIYRPDEKIDVLPPTKWTVQNETDKDDFDLIGVRFSSNDNTTDDIDELRVGSTWPSVTDDRAK